MGCLRVTAKRIGEGLKVTAALVCSVGAGKVWFDAADGIFLTAEGVRIETVKS